MRMNSCKQANVRNACWSQLTIEFRVRYSFFRFPFALCVSMWVYDFFSSGVKKAESQGKQNCSTGWFSIALIYFSLFAIISRAKRPKSPRSVLQLSFELNTKSKVISGLHLQSLIANFVQFAHPWTYTIFLLEHADIHVHCRRTIADMENRN